MRTSSILGFATLLLSSTLAWAASIPLTESSVAIRATDALDGSDPCIPIDGDICIPIPSFTDLETCASAGTAWGPVYPGNFKIYVIKPHNDHSFGKSKTAGVWHINVHVDKARVPVEKGYDPLINLHVAIYQQGNGKCLYIYDSVSKKTHLDKCYGDWQGGISEAVKTVKDVVKTLLDNANLIASAVVLP